MAKSGIPKRSVDMNRELPMCGTLFISQNSLQLQLYGLHRILFQGRCKKQHTFYRT